MKVVQLVPSLSRLGGGMFESVRHLSQSLCAFGDAEVLVIGLSDNMTAFDIATWAPVPVQAHRARWPASFGYSPTVRNALTASSPHVMHLHGLWTYLAIAVSKSARRSNTPYIISPRGMLEPWALKQSALRKKIALATFQRAALDRAACIHATSSQEARSVRQLGLKNPIAVIPNGAVLPPAWQRVTHDNEIRNVLFLSRLHPKKGLLNLLTAWHALKPKGWRLLIAGPNEKNHLQMISAVARRLDIDKDITFLGDVRAEAKADVYSSADLFILPSYSENFGLVVAEALSFGIPTITTRATPWEDLEKHDCGWWINVGVEPLVKALKEAINLPGEQLKKMGVRGRRLIEQKYTWDKIARQMLDVYGWLIGTAARPPCLA